MGDHLEVFDTTLAETHLWLKAVAAELSPCDQHQAYQVLRATLHALRDRLSPEAAINFSAQLPMLLRGVFTEGCLYRPGTRNNVTPTERPNAAQLHNSASQTNGGRISIQKPIIGRIAPIADFWPAPET